MKHFWNAPPPHPPSLALWAKGTVSIWQPVLEPQEYVCQSQTCVRLTVSACMCVCACLHACVCVCMFARVCVCEQLWTSSSLLLYPIIFIHSWLLILILDTQSWLIYFRNRESWQDASYRNPFMFQSLGVKPWCIVYSVISCTPVFCYSSKKKERKKNMPWTLCSELSLLDRRVRVRLERPKHNWH